MLIPLDKIIKQYKMNITGVIHLGAHLGEEAEAYKAAGISQVFWIEGNPELMPPLRKALEPYPDQLAICTLVSNTHGEKVMFNITTDPQGTAMSSSLLELELHRVHAPDVKKVKEIEGLTTTVDHLDEMFDFSDCNFMNLDLQGAELLALEGSVNTLKHVEYVYTEVNTGYVYRDCVLLPELDAWLYEQGFVRVEIEMTPAEWGDALYLRRNA